MYAKRLAQLFCNVKKSKEIEFADKLKQHLQASFVHVKDTTAGGGCGQMFTIQIQSHLFKDKPLVIQHQMVNDILKTEIKEIHGFTLKTRAPKSQIPKSETLKSEIKNK